jgi:cold shock CspA family protein
MSRSSKSATPPDIGALGPRLMGIVRFFFRKKGYGFIRRADGEELFFNIADVPGASVPDIESGQHYEFSRVPSDDPRFKDHAVHMRRLA